MNLDLLDKIRQRSVDLYEKTKANREYLHQHPELSYEEFETMKFVSSKLTGLGIEHETGVATTGIVAVIRGDHHSEMDACIGLRADMDALPIHEQNDVDYRSKNDGKMHACGHDVHTSVLLGAAEIIQEFRNELKKPVKLIFQPGEEKNPGGAGLMIKDGCLQNPSVEEMYALHVFPDFEVGHTGFKEGLYMASCDEIYLHLKGKGGHGATPHKTVDTILMGAEMLLSLQQVVSRNCDPKIPCVLSFGHFEAIGATNVVPETALVKGTFRTMNEEWRAEALELIKNRAEHIALAYGGEVEVEISHGYPYLENNPELTRKIKSKAVKLLGDEFCHDLPIRLTSEDFSFYSQEIPTAFFRIGVGNKEKGITHSVHHPKFDIDPESLKTGVAMMALACFDI